MEFYTALIIMTTAMGIPGKHLEICVSSLFVWKTPGFFLPVSWKTDV